MLSRLYGVLLPFFVSFLLAWLLDHRYADGLRDFQDMFLVPKIMGKVTGLGPAAILLSLSFWGALMGVIGMIIALPLTTLGISCYKHYVLHEPFMSKQIEVANI